MVSTAKEIRIVLSAEQWDRFDILMQRYGYQSYAEAIRAAINKVIEQEQITLTSDGSLSAKAGQGQ